MSGFGAALSAIANPLTAVAGGEQQGILKGNQINTNNLMDEVQLQRQMAQDQLNRQEIQARIGLQGAQQSEADARSAALTSPPQKPHSQTWDAVNRVFVDPETQQVTTPVNQPAAKDEAPITRNTSNGIEQYNRQTGGWDLQKDANGKPLMPFVAPTPKLVPVLDPSDPAKARTILVPESQAAGMQAPPHAGAGGGGGSLDADSKAKMLNQAKIDNDTMKQIENKWMQTGTVPGVPAGTAGNVAELHGSLGSALLSAEANKLTGVMDPDYQRYLTAQRSYGRVMANLQSKRYSDNQAQIEKSISGVAASDLGPTITYKQQLRDASLNDPTIGASPSAPASPASGGFTFGGKTYKVP